jgi:hypothetical protein
VEDPRQDLADAHAQSLSHSARDPEDAANGRDRRRCIAIGIVSPLGLVG